MSTQAEVAKALGLSDRWLRELVAAGAIVDPGRGNWDLVQTARQLIGYREREMQRMSVELAAVSEALQAKATAKDAEGLRKAKLQADKAEFDLAVKQGKLVPIEQVTAVWQSAVLIAKTRLNAIPVSVASRVHAAPTIAAAESEIRKEIEEALEGLDKVSVVSNAAA